MAIEIFWISGSPYAWRVLLAAEVKGVPYVSRLISVSKGENKTPEYLAMNPRGQVPLIKDGDFVLTESMAIVLYLDTLAERSPLFAGSARERARIFEAVSAITTGLDPATEAFADPIIFGRPDDPAPLVKNADRLKRELGYLEARLAGAPWLCGAAITAADIAAYPFLMFTLRAANKDFAKDLDLGLLPFEKHYPKLAAWAKQIEALPGYDRTYPPHWRE
jgi:glutathione S-transferase